MWLCRNSFCVCQNKPVETWDKRRHMSTEWKKKNISLIGLCLWHQPIKVWIFVYVYCHETASLLQWMPHVAWTQMTWPKRGDVGSRWLSSGCLVPFRIKSHSWSWSWFCLILQRAHTWLELQTRSIHVAALRFLLWSCDFLSESMKEWLVNMFQTNSCPSESL